MRHGPRRARAVAQLPAFDPPVNLQLLSLGAGTSRCAPARTRSWLGVGHEMRPAPTSVSGAIVIALQSSR